LFVAAGVPEDHLRWLEEKSAALRSSLRGARWTERVAQHVTLKFLGATPVDKVEPVIAAVSTAAAGRSPAQVSLTQVGAFPSRRRARVLWMGLDDPSGLLTGLAADLDRVLRPLGYEPEKRAFTPHLTLARFKSPGPLPEDASLVADELQPFTVDHVTLWRSRLHPTGARYEEVEIIKLRERGSADSR
jgi:RNA 2',3'-cyclic 3'-phosphodiesterase